ncbi:hypothetical protein BU24DRAFT_421262 [Aaosphaeria arxii CBS 175.79]|uniref:Uncharacterized protein n=1 Tax=Aaosphaeria arxii CBS 175.79 TaxID=1450172 RepID=A0A6A5XZE0_9PLEO|nr:uncharacterized protein BU24DRAFT_421262 [Aaosphaeria arxii CBS 175.79]KAF2018273.1 hypothetical protein BU24DRAFT_421262 [Aaosphaeria arxii CBS 175.79]
MTQNEQPAKHTRKQSPRMPAGRKRTLFTWSSLTIPFLLSLPSLVQTEVMHSLSSSFTIEVGGKPIASVGEGTADKTQAKVGTEGALFTLKDGRLQSGDWILGRNITEDRSLLPKQLLWFKSTEESNKQVQPVAIQQEGDSFQITFANAPLVVEEDHVFADIQSEDHSNVAVKIQQ